MFYKIIKNISIIYLICKFKKIPFYIANNVKLLKTLRADGLYISAYNQKLNLNNLKENYEIIGAAHNIKEVNIKATKSSNYAY